MHGGMILCGLGLCWIDSVDIIFGWGMDRESLIHLYFHRGFIWLKLSSIDIGLCS